MNAKDTLSNISTWFKNHWICFCIMILIFISCLTVLTFGTNDSAVGYMSFASSAVSIVLAILAIIFSVWHQGDFQRNISRMECLLTEQKVGTEAKLSSFENLLSRARLDTPPETTTDQSVSTDVEAPNLNINGLNFTSILWLYVFSKARDRNIRIDETLFNKLEKCEFIREISQAYGECTCVSSLLRAFSDKNQFNYDSKTLEIEVIGLQADIESERISTEIDEQFELGKYRYREIWKNCVDEYFAR